MSHKVCKLRVGSAKFWCITQFLAWRSLAVVEADPWTWCPWGFLNDNEPRRSQPIVLLGIFFALCKGITSGLYQEFYCSPSTLYRTMLNDNQFGCFHWFSDRSGQHTAMWVHDFTLVSSEWEQKGKKKLQNINQLWCDNGRREWWEAANCLSPCPPLWIISHVPTWRRIGKVQYM